MAIGDDATDAGLPLVDGSAPDTAQQIDDFINETRDMIARGIASWLDTVKVPLERVEGTITVDRVETTTDPVLGVGKIPRYNTAGKLASVAPTAPLHTANKQYVDDKFDDIDLSSVSAAQTTANQAKNGELNAAVYGRTLSGQWRSLYVSSAGTLGWVSSSRRNKQDIAQAPVDVQAVLAMEVVTFHYIGGDELHHGLIAEDLHDLGLTWLVDYGIDGTTPEGVRYDLLALALIPAIKDAHALARAAHDRLDALTGGEPTA